MKRGLKEGMKGYQEPDKPGVFRVGYETDGLRVGTSKVCSLLELRFHKI